MIYSMPVECPIYIMRPLYTGHDTAYRYTMSTKRICLYFPLLLVCHSFMLFLLSSYHVSRLPIWLMTQTICFPQSIYSLCTHNGCYPYMLSSSPCGAIDRMTHYCILGYPFNMYNSTHTHTHLTYLCMMSTMI